MRIFGKQVNRGVLIAIALIIVLIVLGVSSKVINKQADKPKENQIKKSQEESKINIEDLLLGRWKNTKNGEIYYFHENNEVDISNIGHFEYSIDNNTIEILDNNELFEKLKFSVKENNLVFFGDRLVRLDESLLGLEISFPKLNSNGALLIGREDNKEFYIINENLQIEEIDLTEINKEYEIISLSNFSKDGKAVIEVVEKKLSEEENNQDNEEDNQESKVGVVDKEGNWIVNPVYSGCEDSIKNSFPNGNFGIFIDTRPDEYGERIKRYKLVNVNKGIEIGTINPDRLEEEVKIFFDTALYNGKLYYKNGQKKEIEQVTNLLNNSFYTENLNYEEQNNYIIYKDRDKGVVYSFDNKLNLVDKKPFDIDSIYRLTKNGEIHSFKNDEIVKNKEVIINGKNYRSVFTYYPVEELMENIHGYRYFQAIKDDGGDGYFVIIDKDGKVVLNESNRIIEINEEIDSEDYYQLILVRILDEENNFIKDEEKILDLRNCKIIEFAEFVNAILEQIGMSYNNIDDEIIKYKF